MTAALALPFWDAAFLRVAVFFAAGAFLTAGAFFAVVVFAVSAFFIGAAFFVGGELGVFAAGADFAVAFFAGFAAAFFAAFFSVAEADAVRDGDTDYLSFAGMENSDRLAVWFVCLVGAVSSQ